MLKHKNILFTIIGLIILFFGYWYFFLSKKDTTATDSNLSLTSSTASNGTSTYDKEFITNLQTVRYIDLNTTVLTSNSYKAMTFPEKPFEVDYNIPVGRRNPFLPIGVDAKDTGTAQTQVQNTPVTPAAATTTTATTTNTPAKAR